MSRGVYRVEHSAGDSFVAGRVGPLGCPELMYRVVAIGSTGTVHADRRELRRDGVEIAVRDCWRELNLVDPVS